MRIAFLYNHSMAHQVPHTAPYAFALSIRYPHLDVVLAYSSTAERAFLDRIALRYPGHRCRFRALTAPGLYRLVDPVLKSITFEIKKQVLRHNLAFFRECDALVSPELTCLRLKRIHRLEHLRMILAPHGAGDRAVGYDPRIAEFDFVLVPGEKTHARMLESGCIRDATSRVTGYAKLEALGGAGKRRLFDNARPTVLYNPHFEPTLSSWQRWGHAVLDQFADSGDYNLVCAPHVILFQRFLRHRAWLPGRDYPAHVLIDRGSERCIDMTYTRAADIYLGDVSSQVYEFLHDRPRPCIFLNAHGADWRQDPNYAHWHLGEVIDDVGQLPSALKRAPALFQQHYRQRQEAALAQTFASVAGQSVADHGADVIATQLREWPSRRCSQTPATGWRPSVSRGVTAAALSLLLLIGLVEIFDEDSPVNSVRIERNQ